MAVFLPGTKQALRFFGGADAGAQIHNCGGIVGRMFCAGQGLGFFTNKRHYFFDRSREAIHTTDNANDVSVDNGFGLVESQG